MNLTWHFELLSQLRRTEVKYAGFRRHRDELPADLVRRVLRGLRKAIIAISDDRDLLPLEWSQVKWPQVKWRGTLFLPAVKTKTKRD